MTPEEKIAAIDSLDLKIREVVIQAMCDSPLTFDKDDWKSAKWFLDDFLADLLGVEREKAVQELPVYNQFREHTTYLGQP